MSALYSTGEKELLQSLVTGDQRAFELLYHQYKDRVYNKLLKLIRTDEIAEELLQDVFYKVWKNREQLDKIVSFSAYLYRMAGNLVADFYRKAALDKELQDQLIYSATELYHHIEDYINYKESNELLDQAIALLPPQRRLVFHFCKIEGKSYEEVSSLLGISRSTINDHMVKASKSIKNHFSRSQDIALVFAIACLLHHA